MDHLASVIAVVVVVAVVVVLFAPGFGLSAGRFLRDIEFMMHWWFPGMLD